MNEQINEALAYFPHITLRYGGPGNEGGKFYCPTSICVGLDDDILVVDSTNQRIVIFNKLGEFKTSFGKKGKKPGYFLWPAGIT